MRDWVRDDDGVPEPMRDWVRDDGDPEPMRDWVREDGDPEVGGADRLTWLLPWAWLASS